MRLHQPVALDRKPLDAEKKNEYYLWTIVIMIRRTMKTLQMQLSPLGLMEIGPNGNALGPSYLVCVLPYPLLPCRCAFFFPPLSPPFSDIKSDSSALIFVLLG